MKKDFRPICIYIIGSLIATIIATILVRILGFDIKDTELIAILGTIILYIGLHIVFGIIYKKKIIEDVKRLNKKDVTLSIIFGLLTVAVNILLSSVIPYESDNQGQVVDLIMKYKIIGSIAICICAPVVEEFLFRYSLDTIFKNKWVFIIASSLIFGIAHALDITAIIYIFIGFMLSYSYIKSNKNIVSPIIIHLINNIISVLSIFLGF